MRKSLIIICLCLIFVSFVSAFSFSDLFGKITGNVVETENLIKNGDFEIGNAGQKIIPQNWNKNSVNDGVTIYDIKWTSFRKGAFIQVREPKKSLIGIKSDQIPVKPNTKYNLNGLLYCEDCLSSKDFYLTFRVGKKGEEGISHYNLENSEIKEKYTHGYDKTEIVFTTNDEEDLFVYVIATFRPGKTGKVYVDEVELKEVGEREKEKIEEEDFFISVATLKDKYEVGEKIELTDPPEPSENNNEANKIYSTSEIIINENINGQRIYSTEEKIDSERLNFKGYIIQFEEEPIVVKEKQLNQEKEENQKYIREHPILGVAKRVFLINTDEEVENKLKEHKEEIEEEHDKLKGKIFNKVSKITGKAISNENSLGLLGEYKTAFNGIALDISEEQSKEIKKISGIKEVYPNYEVHTTLMDSVPLIQEGIEAGKLDINGNNCVESGEECLTGEGVTIAIIDTGVDYTHPDLGGCFGDGCKVVDGYDFINNDKDPMDDHGHGTHCAGIAAGNGVLKGVAPDAKIYAYKVLNSGGSGNSNNIIASIERAIDPNQDGDFSDHVDIISMSLGGLGNPDDAQSQAVDNAVSVGVVVVIAAGNSGPNEETIGSPGTARNAITVGAINKENNIAHFSSLGPVVWEDEEGNKKTLIKPDVVAPGVDICAAQYDSAWEDSKCLDNEHTAISGTSMATPHVAGAVALIKQAHLEWSPEEIKMALRNTADDIGSYIYTQGYGKIDIIKTLQLESKPCMAKIDTNGEIRKIIDIKGSAYCDEFKEYKLSFEKRTSDFQKTFSFNEEVINGNLLFEFDTTILEEGEYILKLIVKNKDLTYSEDRSIVYVKNVEISNPLKGELISEEIIESGELEIDGSVIGEGFVDYVVEYSTDSLEWFSNDVVLTNDGKNQVNDNLLAKLDLSLIDIPINSLRLTVNYNNKESISKYKNIILDKRIKEHWPIQIGDDYSENEGIQYFPALHDFDKDGKQEIVIVGSENMWIYDVDGNLLDGWPQRGGFGGFLSGGFFGGISIGDVDNDGEDEIVTGWAKGIKVYEINGEYNQYYIDELVNQVSLSDLNKDDRLELIFGYNKWKSDYDGWGKGVNYEINVLNYNLDGTFTSLEGWPYEFLDGAVGGKLVIGDVDNDGELEIITKISEESKVDEKFIHRAKIISLNKEGVIEKEFKILETDSSDGGIETGPILVDIDDDGDLEIGFTSRGFNREGKIDYFEHLTFLNYNGETVEGWPYTYEESNRFYNNWEAPVIGDLNNDGLVEIISWRYSARGKDNDMVVALDSKGNKLHGWPFYFAGDPSFTTALIIDVNNDGNQDVIMPTAIDWKNINGDEILDRNVYFLNNNGEQIYPPLKLPAPSFWETIGLVAGDIDGDGKIELAGVTNDFGNEGLMVVWDIDGEYDIKKADCPTYMYNDYLTGCYDCDKVESIRTEPQSKIVNNENYDLNGRLIIRIEKEDGSKLEIINKQYTVPANGLIKLDKIFNPENVKINSVGEYKVVVEFLGEEAEWEFEVI